MPVDKRRVSNICACTALLFLFFACPADAVHLYNPAGQDYQRFGAALSEWRDLTGATDSWRGLLVGVPDHPSDLTPNGRVDVWFAGTELTLLPDMVLSGSNNELFGFAVERIGDVNDGGRDDFAVGAPGYDGSGLDDGRLYLWYGESLDTAPDVILEGGQAYTGYNGGQFGFAVAAAGDVNGDGIDDLIVGAPYADAGANENGAAFVYYGGGLSHASTPDLTLTGAVAGDHFGWSVYHAGNFLGGNEDCIVVGAPDYDGFFLRGGAAYVFAGAVPPLVPDATPDLTLQPGATNAAEGHFGSVVRGLGRWNSDSYDDIAVGTPYDPDASDLSGRVDVYFGGPLTDGNFDRDVNGELADDQFGYALDDVGDVTGNGRADLLIGAPGQDGDGAGSGRAYIYEGGSSSYASAASLIVLHASGVRPGSLAMDAYGAAVSSAGDFDGDGHLDVAIGAPNGNNRLDALSGYVHLRDSSGTVVPAFLLDWAAAWLPDGAVELRFGLLAAPEDLANLYLARRVLAGGQPVAAPQVVLDAPPALAGGLTFEGGQWRLVDRPDILPAGTELSYELVATLTGGDRVELRDLAGPSPLPSAVAPELGPAHPNPFNPRTTLGFRAAAGAALLCRVLDVRGRQLAVLFRGRASGNWQSVQWNGCDDAGRAAAAGLYLVQLEADGRTLGRRIVLAK
jgi:hypothetical protein